jgi:Divergent InlB B-repeat domain
MGDFDSTSRVSIGRYELEVGAPAGTLVVSRAGDGDPGALARALREKPARRTAIDRAESAEEAAARTADGLELLTDILKGVVLEPQRAVKHADLLLELMQRLDDEGRLADALRVARAVNGALALLMRWVELVRSLRSALHAAEKLGNKPAIAWAHHELGTLHLAADDAASAERHLARARTIRKLLGDKDGLAATERNLGYLCRQLCDMVREERLPPPGWGGRRGLVLAAVMTLCFFIAVAVATAIVKPHDKPELIAWVQGQGRVVSAPAGIDCHGGRCEASFAHGEQTTLTATARPGSRFAGWSGDCHKRHTVCHVRLDHTRGVTAHFVPAPHTKRLHVQKVGDGRVIGSSRIDCGTACTTHVKKGSSIRLVAKPGPGSFFDGWSRPCPSSGPCVLKVNDDVNVTARFKATSTSETRQLTVKPTGSGTVSSSPAGISCGTQCANSFPKDKQVVLKAVAADGSRFTGWGAPCTGTGPCTITLHGNVAVTANFETTSTPDPTLTVNPVGEGSGTVQSRSRGIFCGTQCSATFKKGTVALIETPDNGSVFAGWTGAGCSSARVCVVTLTQDTEVTATFHPAPPPRLTTSSTGHGTLTPACTDGCPYDPGATATLTAAPDATYHVIWDGCTQDASDPNVCKVTMTQDRDVSATFDRDVG